MSAKNRKRMTDTSHPKSGGETPAGGRGWKGLGVTFAIGIIACCLSGYFVLFRGKTWTRGTSDSPHTNVPAAASLLQDSPAGGDTPLLEVATAQTQSQQSALAAALNPQSDGWDSEAVSEECLGRLRQILAAVSEEAESSQPATPSAPSTPSQDSAMSVAASDRLPDAWQGLLTSDFRCTSLRPRALREVFTDPSIVVQREDPPQAIPPDAWLEGLQGLRQALQALAEPLTVTSSRHTHAKLVRVALEGDAVRTSALIEASGRSATGAVQQQATWDCVWRRGPNQALQLASLEARDYEAVTTQGSEGSWFSDCTRAVLGANPCFEDQILHGLNHWLRRIERVHGMHAFARWGLAVGDCNGDGREDLYLCQPGGLPNRLFVQKEDGTAYETSAAAGVDWLDHSSSALFVDLDNDGDQDLVVATTSGLLLMANDGAGKFQLQGTLAPADVDLQSLTACDYDLDGDLDLYICVDFANRRALRDETLEPFVYHDANDGGANLLYRNDIDLAQRSWRFTDVTQEVGLDEHNRRHSLAAAWEDYDNDGDPDLYVANDYGQNCLYRNDAGHFVDQAAFAGVEDFGSGMSVSWGDYNRDGWPDLYVGNMFSSAGNRITRQQQFKPGADPRLLAVYSRFAKGNSLFANRGNGTFEEVGPALGVEMARWAWSSVFSDLNNDGWEDLLVANGYISTEDTGDL
jgi:FG-GAP-like repeat